MNYAIFDVQVYRQLLDIQAELYREKPLSGDERRDLADKLSVCLDSATLAKEVSCS